jgi:hypothetical protein
MGRWQAVFLGQVALLIRPESVGRFDLRFVRASIRLGPRFPAAKTEVLPQSPILVI